jgi:hypothetical protein
VGWFPGGYFDSRVKAVLQAEVMNSWPGPSQLLQLWDSGQLEAEDQVSLLLGGAVFHDPVLLPAYRDAVTSPSQRVRQAAVYGFRDLIGDSMPDVGGGISDADAALLGEEMEWVAQTLDSRTLLEMWLQSLLAVEKSGFPGWSGVILRRQPDACIRAIERMADTHDLNLLLEAYDLTQDFGTRVNLLKIIEAVTLSRFIIMPEGSHKKGWGRQVFVTAMGGLESARRRWTAGSCAVQGEAVLKQNLEAMGVAGLDPFAEEGCQVWVNVLERGFPRWWMLAARRLYACGGPWVEFSVLSPDGPRDQERRNRLLQWFGPLRPNAAPSASPARPAPGGRRYND